MNSSFSERTGRPWTWRTPNDAIRDEIDFILTDKRKLVADASVILESAVSVHPDHRLMRAKFRVDFEWEGRIRNEVIYCDRPKHLVDDSFLQAIESQDWIFLKIIRTPISATFSARVTSARLLLLQSEVADAVLAMKPSRFFEEDGRQWQKLTQV
ncbi:unnamed protein product [Toxocara canis]|uniref:Neur_chan_LBD domain-containing protein n=1 Tax=Toxocara canis TaxID=6265 RepID=A0A183UTB5_TOXCA|nr:unnamed protein product [Toxocara canis]